MVSGQRSRQTHFVGLVSEYMLIPRRRMFSATCARHSSSNPVKGRDLRYMRCTCTQSWQQ